MGTKELTEEELEELQKVSNDITAQSANVINTELAAIGLPVMQTREIIILSAVSGLIVGIIDGLTNA